MGRIAALSINMIEKPSHAGPAPAAKEPDGSHPSGWFDFGPQTPDTPAAAADEALHGPLAALGALVWTSHVTPADARALADLTEHRRIVVLRQGMSGISYSTLVSVLLAVLIESSLFAGFYLLAHWVGKHGHTGGRVVRVLSSDAGTAIGGVQFLSPMVSGRRTKPVTWLKQPLPLPPGLPNRALWKPDISAPLLLDPGNSHPGQQVLIGLKAGSNPWLAPMPTVAPKILHAPPKPREIRPNPTRSSARSPRQSSRVHTRSRRGVNPNAGFGRPYSLVKSNVRGAYGFGRSGPGRGPSAGNDPYPEPIRSTPLPLLPLKYQFSPPKKSPVFKITVLPDGKAGHITVVRSSNHPSVDQACIDAIRQWKFRPAIRNGKPVVGYITEKFVMHDG